MQHYVFDLNENGSSKLYCKITESPLGMNTQPRPAFMWIPGGGFAACAPEDGEPIILSLTAHGYAGFTMTYPAGPDYRFPDVLVLMSKAILMIRAHAEEWNIDPNKIVIGGGSAGGFISAAYGAFWNHPEMQKLTGCSQGENRPNALLTQNGLFNAYQQTAEGTKAVSVYDYVGKDMPPAFILHAADDSLVSVDQALALAWNMSRAQKPFSLFISDSGNHTGLQNYKRTIVDTGWLSACVDDWMPAALTFLDNVLGVEPGYQKFSLPSPGEVHEKEAPPDGPPAPPAGEMPQMDIGTYESGMVWGFAGTDADKLSWEK
ncbi:MAG: alpha/beta hydrolase [Oscillospiraceae bacterium]|nr:alpha/beta hydrolase [Oscillospiraceae bacterium]